MNQNIAGKTKQVTLLKRLKLKEHKVKFPDGKLTLLIKASKI